MAVVKGIQDYRAFRKDHTFLADVVKNTNIEWNSWQNSAPKHSLAELLGTTDLSPILKGDSILREIDPQALKRRFKVIGENLQNAEPDQLQAMANKYAAELQKVGRTFNAQLGGESLVTQKTWAILNRVIARLQSLAAGKTKFADDDNGTHIGAIRYGYATTLGLQGEHVLAKLIQSNALKDASRNVGLIEAAKVVSTGALGGTIRGEQTLEVRKGKQGGSFTAGSGSPLADVKIKCSFKDDNEFDGNLNISVKNIFAGKNAIKQSRKETSILTTSLLKVLAMAAEYSDPRNKYTFLAYHYFTPDTTPPEIKNYFFSKIGKDAIMGSGTDTISDMVINYKIVPIKALISELRDTHGDSVEKLVSVGQSVKAGDKDKRRSDQAILNWIPDKRVEPLLKDTAIKVKIQQQFLARLMYK